MSILSLLAALVASGTALWIACRVYPVQKSADRRIKIAEEKAAVYRGFFESADDYNEASKAFWRGKSVSDFQKHFAELNKAQNALLLYAPPEVIAEGQAYVRELHRYRYAVRQEVEKIPFPRNMEAIGRAAAFHKVNDARNRTVIAARVDLFDCSAEAAARAVNGQAAQEESEQENT